jgi:type I restriction enzyme S subunit
VSVGRWPIVTLGDLIKTIEAGSSFRCRETPPEKGEVGVAKVSAVSWGRYDEQESKTCLDASRINNELLIRKGDFLISRANTVELVGACVIAEQVRKKVMLSDKTLRILFKDSGVKPWVLHYLRSRAGRQQIEALCTGNQESMRNISQRSIRNIKVPLAPPEERDEILAFIELQLSSAEATTSTLQGIQAKLKQARASILKAAVEGRLVETEAALAKKEHRDFHCASERMIEGHQRSKTGRKSRGGRHLPFQTTGTHEKWREYHSSGWHLASVGQLIDSIQAGKSFAALNIPPSMNETGIAKISAVTWGTYNENESKTVTNTALINEVYIIQEGDLLMSRANTVERVGAAVIAKKVLKRIMLSDKVLRLHAPREIKEWLLWVLRSPYGRQQIESLCTGNQDSMRNIGQDRILSIRVPLPPLQEQLRITEEINRRFSILDQVESTASASLARCALLRQAILKRAFEGRLVPAPPESSDPADHAITSP